MELSAIYHRPESEYAYLYKDKKLHIRIRTKKGDIESITLHYGDPLSPYKMLWPSVSVSSKRYWIRAKSTDTSTCQWSNKASEVILAIFFVS